MAARIAAGLCDSCRHQHLISTTRGSTFSRCQRHFAEPARFPKYPRIPVTACAGYERRQRSDLDGCSKWPDPPF